VENDRINEKIVVSEDTCHS
jgi:hypothetical protein